jgi:hypothetical protein
VIHKQFYSEKELNNKDNENFDSTVSSLFDRTKDSDSARTRTVTVTVKGQRTGQRKEILCYYRSNLDNIYFFRVICYECRCHFELVGLNVEVRMGFQFSTLTVFTTGLQRVYNGFTTSLQRVQRVYNGFTTSLQRVQRVYNGFTTSLQRVYNEFTTGTTSLAPHHNNQIHCIDHLIQVSRDC